MRDHPELNFDLKLAEECAKAFSVSTGLGCTVSDTKGTVLYECGPGCAGCRLCSAASLPMENCIRAHNYGMTEAERFGGKYIYFCPLGLTCFVSPIIGDVASTAKITVGPFMMVDLQDFIDCELTENLHLEGETLKKVVSLLEQVPQITPKKVQELSVLLFMAVGFMNNVSAENRLLEAERSGLLQGQINSYITELKSSDGFLHYPFDKEHALLQSVVQGDRKTAKRQLEELLAALFASGGGDLGWIKARSAELIIMLSRTAIENGSDEEQTMLFNLLCQKVIPSLKSFSSLSAWLYDTLGRFMDSMFSYPDVKHASLIHKSIQYIGTHYAEHLTLEDTAKAVGLSPDYLSRIFKQETGSAFNRYLNNVRITKAKELIRKGGFRLTDISQLVGYDDQSYFTKVFRRVTGLSPGEYAKQIQRPKK